jgi:hypothetical protein
LEINAGIELERSTSWAALLKAEWSELPGRDFRREYRGILRGYFPKHRERLKFSGVLESVREKRLELNVNVFNWLKFEHSRSRSFETRLKSTPDGGLLFEQVSSLRRRTSGWGKLESLRLTHTLGRPNDRSDESLDFVLAREGRFTQDEVRRFLRVAAHCGVIESFELPGHNLFPLRLHLLLKARFSPQGVESILSANVERLWRELVRSLELSEPQRYAKGSFWRDWMEVPKLREIVAEDPAQAHLVSRYPVRGRTPFERKQVVFECLRFQRFLKGLCGWHTGRLRSLPEVYRSGFDLALFLFLHRLCPRKQRRSVVLLTGEMSDLWGNPSLLSAESGGNDLPIPTN